MFKINQFNQDDFLVSKINYFIGSSGYESRSTFQAKLFSDKIEKNTILSFKEEKSDKSRQLNDSYFKKNGFNLVDSDVEGNRKEALDQILKEINKVTEENDNVNIYIDYSSMTKNWYSYILYGLFNLENKINLNIYLGYSHAKYSAHIKNDTYNRVVNPLFGYCNLTIPSKPTSIVIGLGNDSNRVFGLKEYFDAIPFIFHSDETYNEEYYKEAKSLLDKYLPNIPKENIYQFPISDMVYTYLTLENFCLELANENRVIMAPCGPKPFAILCMLLSLKYEELIEVWRISPGVKIRPINRKATGLVTILEIKFDK